MDCLESFVGDEFAEDLGTEESSRTGEDNFDIGSSDGSQSKRKGGWLK